jgi:O-antigen/teichoic acid export membrane protein
MSGVGVVTAPPETGRRELAARGTLINSGFQIGLGGLNLIKTLVAAAFLTASDFGVWGVVLLTVSLAGIIKAAVIADKYIQQSEEDQVLAFQKAFTLELIFAGGLLLAMGGIAPLFALLYGQWNLLAPALLLSLTLLTGALHAPTWIFYRRMDFFKQRLILAIDPLVAFFVTVPLAVAGAGYWALVAGIVVGSAVGGLVASLLSPIKLRLVYHRETMRDYLGFSWPLVVAGVSGIMIGQVSLLLGDLALGFAAVGAIAIASTFTVYTDTVDRIITSTLYPAVCRVVDRHELLLETFVKSNRLTLMWGMPFGVALTLFASDLVDFGIGDQYTDAIILFQVFGVVAAINHIGFNWDAFYRARGETKPIAVVATGAFSTLLLVGGPLLFILESLDGYAIGIATMTAVSLILRWRYVTKLFPGFEVARYMLRAIAPTVPATAAVILMRQLETGERTLTMSLSELALYLAITVGATLVLEGGLLREAWGYLRRRGGAAPIPGLSPSGSGG